MTYPAYGSYQKAKTDFVGLIPSHWEEWKVSHGFAQIGSGTTPKSDNSLYYGGETLWVTTSELRESFIFETTNHVTQEALNEHSALKAYAPGSVVIAMYGATIGRLGMLGKEATVNQACCVFSAPEKFYPRFFYFWLWMRRPILISLSSGGGQPNLNQEELKRLRVPIPPIPEQQQIAAFLDWKTGQIDALIARKQELLVKLKEKRLAVITQAVTKGLNPAAQFKPSGLPWCGDIPVHWYTRRLRDISDFITVGVVVNPSSYFSDEGVPFLLGGDIREMKINTESCKRCSEESSNGPLSKSRLETGDIVVVRVGYPGVAAVIPREIAGGNVASMMLVRNHSRYCSQWLAYLINSQVGRDQVEIVQYGAAQKQFNISHAVDFAFPFPPLPEQEAIAIYLDQQTSKIDKLMEITKTAIDRLNEYRTALITAATTGKIDVRGVKIPQPE
jgi:type I restriction enzyme, S subunit